MGHVPLRVLACSHRMCSLSVFPIECGHVPLRVLTCSHRMSPPHNVLSENVCIRVPTCSYVFLRVLIEGLLHTMCCERMCSYGMCFAYVGEAKMGLSGLMRLYVMRMYDDVTRCMMM